MQNNSFCIDQLLNRLTLRQKPSVSKYFKAYELSFLMTLRFF